MAPIRKSRVGALGLFAAAMCASSLPVSTASAQVMLVANTIRRIPAPEADQGAAVTSSHVFAIDNSTIAKYNLKTGVREGTWRDADQIIQHLNSCFADGDALWCANSNYPALPMGSSIEVFDTKSMTPAGTRSLGLRDEGSLVWFDRIKDGWLVCFAHYDGERGAGFKDHRYASVITVDKEWRRTGGWLFPAGIVEKMAPHAASGGALGPDGLLYVMGHDLAEIYVLAKPARGPVLAHVATIAVEAEGQAFSFGPDGQRTIAAVDRRKGDILLIDLPTVDLKEIPAARRFVH